MDAYRKQIEDAYQRNADRPTAFIDESYRGPKEPGRRFYILTAVIVEHHALDELRSGIEKTKDMLAYIGEGDEISVLAMSTSVDANDTDLEGARRDCMTALLPSLQAGTSTRDPVKLAVLEQRQNRAVQNRDAHTHKELVTNGALDRTFRLLQTSPRYEHLLWLPDLVSSAVRRRETKNKVDLFDLIKHNIEML